MNVQNIWIIVYPQMLISVNYFSDNIRILRERISLSQAEISYRLGFSRSAWNNYERGISKPGLDDLFKIIGFFDISASDILETDLSKHEFYKKINADKKVNKNEHVNEFNSDFKPKKYPQNSSLSIVNDDGGDKYYPSTMPKVITVDTQGNENMVMVPVKARAGYLLGYGDPEFIQTLPAYRLPGLNNGTFRIFEVEGLSMYPTLNSGDLVIGSNVEQLGVIRDDRIHIVVTKNEGVVVKRVLNRLKSDDKLILKSDNYKDRDLYPPIVCDPSDILEIWYATGYISRQMRPPAEMYNRVVDLEGRLTLLEKIFTRNKP